MKRTGIVIFMVLLISAGSLAQDRTFYKPTTTFYGKPDTVLSMDFEGIKSPSSPNSFNPLFHFPPVRQDTTGTCWAFAATSYLESELYRLGKGKVKLSEMYIVYHEYLEKARRFIREKGDSYLGQGSEENAALLRIGQYGIVRASDYSGLIEGQEHHSHGKMFKEIRKYLNFLKQNENWDEDMALANVSMILDKYLGPPPEKITVDGVEMTPVQYATEALEIPLEEYVDFMSFKYIPFYTKGEYKVVDNWWHSGEFHNVPLDDWYSAVVRAVKNGYTVAIGGDVSEIGKYGEGDIAIVPEFDIPMKYIDQDAREFRFDNETSGDDHALHLVGYQRYAGQDWFLIKDSGSSATKGRFNGYYFYRGDYLKLKMLTFLVHKDAVEWLLKKF
ncbi:MAG: peptidase C1 [candidate division KSB1 bacterium]|jgi:bleomycin hydrolase|nr:peptidase C1 [candidate division KSB1 bacterium]